MTSYAKRIRDLSPPAGVLAAYDRASVRHGFAQAIDKAAEIAAQADADIQALRSAVLELRIAPKAMMEVGRPFGVPPITWEQLMTSVHIAEGALKATKGDEE